MDKTETAKYIETVGRRKTSIARVRLTPSSKSTIVVNDKDVNAYFSREDLRIVAKDAFVQAKLEQKYHVTALVSGGGISSQAEAIRLGISRAIIEIDHGKRTTLKKLGFLKRDPRAKERRKFGLKKARKAPQWSKR
ncbi:30S ribosomal protein S9 [Candidatus Parcubacteria bacterium]|nr:30S ribosomal protein S9 [Candidatus Parcubacteria bacterium]